MTIPSGFRFDGSVNFLGLDTFAIIDIFTDEVTNHTLMDLRLTLPSFSIGGNNI